MKTKLFAGLALAVALLVGGPAFGDDRRDHGRGGDGGGRTVAAFHGAGARAPAFSGAAVGGYRGGAYRSAPSFAYGGGGYRGSNSTYAFASHNGWSHDRGYNWNGNYYRWYNNGWFIVDPDPYYAGSPYYGGNDYSGPAYTVYGSPDNDDNGGGGGPVSVQVQRELARDGYYRGPIDGIIGSGTRAAIAAYQRDNGLRATGTINGHLLDAMDLD